MLRSFFIFLTHATPTLFPDPQSPAVSQVPSQVKFPAMNRHRRMAYIAGRELAILLSDLLLQANRFLFEDPLIKEILWLPGEFTDEAPCRRHASACQDEAAKAEGAPGSPDRRSPSIINQWVRQFTEYK